ncbi:hypothetical protein ACA910_004856 [Epithemia clementina (nom. ined.)]
MPMHIWGLSIGISPNKNNPKAEDEKLFAPSTTATSLLPSTNRKQQQSSNRSIVRHHSPSSSTAGVSGNASPTSNPPNRHHHLHQSPLQDTSGVSNSTVNEEWSAAASGTLDRRCRIRQRTLGPSAGDEESQTASAAEPIGQLSPAASETASGRRRGPIHHQHQPRHSYSSSSSSSLYTSLAPFSFSRIQCQKLFVLLLRNCTDLNNWQKVWIWAKKNRRLVYCILFSIPFILRPSRLWKWRYSYFGKYNNHGGELGQRIEKWGNLHIFDEVQSQQLQLLNSLGIVLPPAIPTDRSSFHVLKLQSQAAIRELLVRREQRAQTLSKLERHANESMYTCTRNSQHPNDAVSAKPPNSAVSPKEPDRQAAVEASRTINNDTCIIPHVIFVPDKKFGWQSPRPGESQRYQQLLFDEREMRQLITDTRPSLIPLFDGFSQHEIDRIHLWAVCSVFYFGGIFVGSASRSDAKILKPLVWSDHSPVANKRGGAPLLFAIFDDSQKIRFLAATPRHPALLCSLIQWEGIVKAKQLAADRSEFKRYDRLVTDSFLPLHPGHSGWTRATLSLQISMDHQGDSPLCNFETEPLAALPDKINSNGVNTRKELSTEIYVLPWREAETMPLQSSAIKVNIIEETSDAPPKRTVKVSLESQLQQRGLKPGWFCMRCIKIPHYGRMERCTQVCPAGYTDLVCHGPDIPQKIPVNIQVRVSGSHPDYRSGSAIPKLIHQTWFEDVTLDRYPQLARLQNSWKNTGWHYQLYTDETARAYIVEHFPPRFVDAFDALLPGAFQADLFRYLILMREGGIYADVDVLLETNLDQFLTPSLSFFAPRDVVAEFAGEPFCLWNGFIGASPGHPFIVRAVERLINLILDRADEFDMERDLCRRDKGPLDVWKVRLQTLLLLSGPCGLGVAVNEALANPSLQKIDTGWIGLEELEFGGKRDHGDALIMVVDKHDIGGFRISDPERNTIVASTDMNGVEKNAREISNPTEAERKRQQQRQRKELTHYSMSNKGIEVWGSSGVYKDNIVTNERIKLGTSYESNPASPTDSDSRIRRT